MAEIKDVYKDRPLPVKIAILTDISERRYQCAFRSYELVKEQPVGSNSAATAR